MIGHPTILTVSDVEARLIEIAENLHRNELTVAERADQVDEWVRLTTADGSKLAQLAPVKNVGGRGAEGGIREASRVLGLDRREIDRAQAIASMDDDAKEAAVDCGLDDNQSALLEASRAPKERQADVIREIGNAGSVAAYRASQVDGDIRQRAAQEVANLIAEHVPAKFWDGLKANLFACEYVGVAHRGRCGSLAADRFASERNLQGRSVNSAPISASVEEIARSKRSTDDCGHHNDHSDDDLKRDVAAPSWWFSPERRHWHVAIRSVLCIASTGTGRSFRH